MATREEIGEVITSFLEDYDSDSKNPAIDWVGLLKYRLSRQGVVMLKNKELPNGYLSPTVYFGDSGSGRIVTVEEINKAGFEAVDSLIGG